MKDQPATLINIHIRGIDKGIYQRIRVRAIEQGQDVGEIVNEALARWLDASRRGERTMVRVNPVTESLLHIYPRQSEPQSCFISLDLRDGVLTADWNGEVGNAVPSDVYHGIVRRYSIPLLQAETVNALMEDLRVEVQTVMDGAEIVWDGNNHVARLSDRAQEAETAIERALSEIEPDLHWADAGDWLYETREEITARLAAGEPLADLAQELDGDGSKEDPVLIGLTQYLERLQAEA